MSIDDTPLHKISRPALRQRIIAVPQDATFLPEGTSFRANLDPLGTSARDDDDDYNNDNDECCRAVLEAVGLWAFVEQRGGLAGGMSAGALSQGQRQLFNLGRAILRKRGRARGEKSVAGGGILLLDEVSSSVDQDTDRAMQGIIKEEFQGYTIVMVSHRLGMVMEFDTVVVMDEGRVIETGRPRTLVETEGSRFRELWLAGNKG